MACGYQTPCPVNGVWGNRALSASFLNKRYITGFLDTDRQGKRSGKKQEALLSCYLLPP